MCESECSRGKQLEDNSQGELDRHAEEGRIGRWVRTYVRSKQGEGYRTLCVFV
jgi:hypothetical protein